MHDWWVKRKLTSHEGGVVEIRSLFIHHL